jgi:hypothetical protein
MLLGNDLGFLNWKSQVVFYNSHCVINKPLLMSTPDYDGKLPGIAPSVEDSVCNYEPVENRKWCVNRWFEN